ncbi:MAG TPA: hypothetical protein DDZ88_20555 [Verrucomicrobiales bacterium]|nr:hypothetical protein [Verrucomicrobiales bacterium]
MVYLGSDVAGLWRSENEGATWQYLTSGWTPKDCQSLAFDPADADHLFIALSDGIYHSLDRGQSWGRLVVAAHPGGLAVARAGGHLVVYFGTGRSRENTGGDGLFYRHNHGGSGVLESFAYAVTTGALVSTLVNPVDADDLWISSGAGVFRSLDGGETWMAHNTGLPSATCGKLLADPSQFDRLLVAVRGLGGTTGGVAYKQAGTTTWTSLSGNLPVTNVDWTAVATDPAAFGQRVWAGSSQDASGGLFYTANGLDAVPTWTARQTVTEAGWATANPIRTNPHSLIRLADGSLWTGKNGNSTRAPMRG